MTSDRVARVGEPPTQHPLPACLDTSRRGAYGPGEMVLRRRGRCWPLIALGVVLLLGHVCELPLHEPLVLAHAEAGDAHGHDDSVHAGSCEAVATTTSDVPSSTPLADVTVPCRHLVVAVADVVHGAAVDASPPSPPLFLLHAALLI